ncbi:putative endolytic peptidoglycan transglycosylase RlpA [Flavobacterium sp. 9AF]|uniref:septal ring lytic transglycosylase RlpA family protein n=1 Tax=Flavobacterium sp. 9AF TaxID=2653142 RepID=UPI0012F093BD|nr:septal ring lytic transglycosylase RlpA family protein [Flavobacterium sp. 9AF]VXB28619.1 putative endolytic peptidoglycan transglycosylase RlpA [Flavobacterium sp. 9AF]
MKKYGISFLILFLLISISSFTCKPERSFSSKTIVWDTIRKDSIIVDTVMVSDSLVLEKKPLIVFYKEKAHASYYHDKFNGKKTASGSIFNNSKYTAAHKKLPFGTKVLVTNIVNNKSVVVTITDRGPFTKGREIDLSKAAFMELTEQKKIGYILVNLQIVNE